MWIKGLIALTSFSLGINILCLHKINEYRHKNEFLDSIMQSFTKHVVNIMIKHNIDLYELKYNDSDIGVGLDFDIEEIISKCGYKNG